MARVFFTSDCIGELEGLFVSALETGLDFVFGLRLLTPLRPIFLLVLKSWNYKFDLFLAGCVIAL
jgi:hypothetical protein